MNRKHIVLTVLIALSVAVLGALAVNKYEHRPKAVPGETLQQALQGQKNAETALQRHDAVNNARIQSDQNVINTLTAQKSAACSALVAHRLTAPGC